MTASTDATLAPEHNLARRLDRRSEHPAVVTPHGTVGYEELSERVARWRGGLSAAGVGHGDRVALLTGNTIEFVVAYLATMGTGAVTVPFNIQSPPAELVRELAVVTPSALVVGPDGEERFAEVVALDPVVAERRVDTTDLDAADPAPVAAVAADDPAVLVFTSGTAGPPRPAILTHRNLTTSLQAMLSLPVDLVGTPHRFLAVLPLFHVFGLNTVLNMALLIGATVVLDEYRGPAEAVELVAATGATVVAGPPAMWAAINRLPDIGPEELASVRLAASGASKLPPRLKLEIDARFGIDLREGYGLTETSAVLTSAFGTDAPLGSVGRLLPGVEARIVDQDGDDCLVGDPGELWVRGPMVFPGYWGDDLGPDDESPLTPDGWLRTGDVAVVDEQGYLAIVDRRKDLVIVSGFNVFPAEVEGVIRAHPDVQEVGVIGEPSEATGEKVVAFVVPEEGATLDEVDLRALCETELARYKVPSRFAIVDELPTGPTGKLQRSRLR